MELHISCTNPLNGFVQNGAISNVYAIKISLFYQAISMEYAGTKMKQAYEKLYQEWYFFSHCAHYEIKFGKKKIFAHLS